MHKKWYIEGELCRLTKKGEKTSHCNSRELFSRKARAKKNTVKLGCLIFLRSRKITICERTTSPSRLKLKNSPMISLTTSCWTKFKRLGRTEELKNLKGGYSVAIIQNVDEVITFEY